MDLVRKARTRVGVAVISGALLAVGGTATAAVVSSPPAEEVADVTPVTSEPAATTSAPAPEPEPEAAVASVTTQAPEPEPQASPATTVDAVTEPTPDVAPAPQSDATVPAYDPTAPFVQGGLTYVPAPLPPEEVKPPKDTPPTPGN